MLPDSPVGIEDKSRPAGAPEIDKLDHKTVALITPKMVSAAIEFLRENAVHVYSERLVSYEFVYDLLVASIGGNPTILR